MMNAVGIVSKAIRDMLYRTAAKLFDAIRMARYHNAAMRMICQMLCKMVHPNACTVG